jgi:hypothetical protein
MRVVPLPDPAVNVHAELQLLAVERQEYLFVNGKGPAKGDRLKRQNLWRDFQVIRENAGLMNRYGFLRRGADAISLLDEAPRCRMGGCGSVSRRMICFSGEGFG